MEVTTSLSVSLEADPGELSRLLPPRTRLSGAAVLTVTASRLENLTWLAGRGYPVLSVTFPIEHRDETGEALPGRYLAVLWEGLADPITTGREELGFPKLFADIHAPLLDDVSPSGTVGAQASWDGFCFFDLTVEGLRDEPVGQAALPPGTMVHRFLPGLGSPDRAEIDQLVHYSQPEGTRTPTMTDRRIGTGRFSFRHAEFADVPVQYPVINALAALTLGTSGPATLTRTIAAPGHAPGSTPRLLSATAAPPG